MRKYIKTFQTHSAYNTYITGSDKILPNVSYCKDNNDVHYNPWVETRLVATFNVTSTSSATTLCGSSAISKFSDIEIDGVLQTNVVSSYTFDTIGEHTVKYTLVDPTEIGANAFSGCSSLTSITIPNSVTIIKSNAFYDCSSLTNVVIPNGVTSIGAYSFQACGGLTSMTIPNSTTTIGAYAFDSCSGLTSITIPNSVTNIYKQAFYNCSGLTSITCNASTAPTIQSDTFRGVKTGGTLYVPTGSTGYDVWMGTDNYYLGKYSWTKVEQ